MHWEKYYNNFICFVHAGSSSESHFPVVAPTSRNPPVFYVPPRICHVRVSKAGLKPKFSTEHAHDLNVSTGGWGRNRCTAQHSTGDPWGCRTEGRKPSTKAHRFWFYVHKLSKATRSIQTENGFMVFTSVECGKRHWRPQTCPKAKPPFFSAPPKKWLEQRRSQFSAQLHYTLKRQNDMGGIARA